jgi:hypothetical protein
MTRAPAGTAILAPTPVILPPRITTVARSITGPDTGITRALVMAIVSPVSTGWGLVWTCAGRGGVGVGTV